MRFDVRFTGDAALRDGIFQIIAVNGAGSKAIQFWDPSLSLIEAYHGVFAKQAMLFRLAGECRTAGRLPIGLPALARAWWAQLRQMRCYPASNSCPDQKFLSTLSLHDNSSMAEACD